MTRLRLALDLRSRDQFTDVLTGRAPELWRAADVQFELACFDDLTLATDEFATYDQVTLEVKATSDLQGPALLRLTADYADLNRTLTAEQWTAGTLAHATLVASATETALDLDQATSKVFHLVISALTTDDPAKTVILGTSRLTVVESGAGGTNNSPEPAEDYYTATESDARYVHSADAVDLAADVAAAQAAALWRAADVDALTRTVAIHTATLTSQTTAIGEHEARLDDLEAATADATTPGFDGSVRTLLLHGDTVYVAGDFTTCSGQTTRGVAKLSVQGQVDGRFAALSNYAGDFTGWSPKRLALTADGDLLVAAGKYLGKLDPATGEGRNSGSTLAWAAATALGIPTGESWDDVATGVVSGTPKIAALIGDPGRLYTLSEAGTSGGYIVATVPLAGLAVAITADGSPQLALGAQAYLSAGVPGTYAGYASPVGLKLTRFPTPFLVESPYDELNSTFSSGAGIGSKASVGRPLTGYDLTDGAYVLAGNVLGDDDVDHSWNGGSTTQFRGLLKVWLDGTADPDFTMHLVLTAGEGAAIPFAVDGQQRLYFGGPVENINGTAVTPWRLYRVTKAGDFDAEFDGFDDSVRCCVLRDDDTLIVGGDFTAYGGRVARRIAFLDAAGQVIVPAMQGANAGKVWDYAALPDVRNVPALKRGLVCVPADPPTLHRWNATAEEWTTL